MGRKERKERAEKTKKEVQAKFIKKVRHELAHSDHPDEVSDKVESATVKVVSEYPPQQRSLVNEAIREYKQTDDFGKIVEQALKALSDAVDKVGSKAAKAVDDAVKAVS